MNAVEELKIRRMHKDLMEMHFPYHSVSVVEQHGNLRVIFSNGIRDMVTAAVIDHIEMYDFEYSINPK